MSTLRPDRWQEASPYLDRALEMSFRGTCALAGIAAGAESQEQLATLLQALLNEQQVLAEEHFLEEPPVSLFGQPAFAGQTIAEYTLLSPIGQGGMGTLARRTQ